MPFAATGICLRKIQLALRVNSKLLLYRVGLVLHVGSSIATLSCAQDSVINSSLSQAHFFTRNNIYLRRSGPLFHKSIHLAQSARGVDRTISSIDDFNHHVTIASGEEALIFVRLQTSPVVSATFEREYAWYEVYPRERLTLSSVYGSALLLTFLKNRPDGCGGVVSERWMKENHIQSARIVQGKGGWIVFRTCVRIPRNRSDRVVLEEIQETISKTGEYTCERHIIRLRNC